MTDHNPLIHRGIAITRSEVPGAAFTWTHDETDAHGMAETVQEAIRQISTHLSADPNCHACRGKGTHTCHWPTPRRGASYPDQPCFICFPEDQV